MVCRASCLANDGGRFNQRTRGRAILNMTLIEITAIVPRLPPVIDGVGDYAMSLAKELREGYGVDTNFLVGDPTWAGEGKLQEFSVRKLTERNAAALSDALSRDDDATVLLHYGGYAYAQRGCPGLVN